MIKKISKNNVNVGFTVVNNNIINDPNLGLKEKGLFALLWSLPDDWQCYESELETHSSDGIASFRSGLRNLECHGYVKRVRRRNRSGQLTYSDWKLYQTPEANRQFMTSKYAKQFKQRAHKQNRRLFNNRSRSRAAMFKAKARAKKRKQAYRPKHYHNDKPLPIKPRPRKVTIKPISNNGRSRTVSPASEKPNLDSPILENRNLQSTDLRSNHRLLRKATANNKRLSERNTNKERDKSHGLTEKWNLLFGRCCYRVTLNLAKLSKSTNRKLVEFAIDYADSHCSSNCAALSYVTSLIEDWKRHKITTVSAAKRYVSGYERKSRHELAYRKSAAYKFNYRKQRQMVIEALPDWGRKGYHYDPKKDKADPKIEQESKLIMSRLNAEANRASAKEKAEERKTKMYKSDAVKKRFIQNHAELKKFRPF